MAGVSLSEGDQDNQTPVGDGDIRRAAARAARRFVGSETGSAWLLLGATVLALIWANSPWPGGYDDFWRITLGVTVGDVGIELDLKHWVNDGLMVFFFLVLGLEVKQEFVIGELADWRRASVPLAAAAAGLVVPALAYWVLNIGGEAAGAWGVVISTDTAFLLGVLALVGPACPGPLRVFLLTLAVADDVGALSVIAIAYTKDLSVVWLLGAVAGIAVMVLLRRLDVRRGPPYFVLGVAVWVCMYESGVHPTIAGVVIALFVTASPPVRAEVQQAARAATAFAQSPDARFAKRARLSIDRSVSPAERMQLLYQPWASYLIVPLFALANAGVTLNAEILSGAFTSTITLGVIAGLVVGKLVGIYAGTALAVRTGLGSLAPGLGRLQLLGGAALSGIGFTISLFIVDLALTDNEELADQARIGVLTASLIATVLGWALFKAASRTAPAMSAGPSVLDPPVDPNRDHLRGEPRAELELVEYGDFECPFCGQATGSVDQVRAHFGDRLTYVYRHLPLDSSHPHARGAAHAAEAADQQGLFWEMHDMLYAHQDALTASDLTQYAAALSMEAEDFTEAVNSDFVHGHVDDDAASAADSGATGTPTFFINGTRHRGPFDAMTLIEALDEAASRS